MFANQHRRRAWRDRGSSTTEVVIILPVGFLLILLAVQFGVWAHASHVAHAAAHAGIQTARAQDGTTQLAHQETAGMLHNLGGGGLLVAPTVTVDRDATTATVRVEGTAAAVVPGLHLPVRVELSGPVDQWTPGS